MEKIIVRLVDGEGNPITTLRVPPSTTLGQLVRYVVAKRPDLAGQDLLFRLGDSADFAADRSIEDAAREAGLDLASGITVGVRPAPPVQEKLAAKSEAVAGKSSAAGEPEEFWKKEVRKTLTQSLSGRHRVEFGGGDAVEDTVTGEEPPLEPLPPPSAMTAELDRLSTAPQEGKERDTGAVAAVEEDLSFSSTPPEQAVAKLPPGTDLAATVAYESDGALAAAEPTAAGRMEAGPTAVLSEIAAEDRETVATDPTGSAFPELEEALDLGSDSYVSLESSSDEDIEPMVFDTASPPAGSSGKLDKAKTSAPPPPPAPPPLAAPAPPALSPVHPAAVRPMTVLAPSSPAPARAGGWGTGGPVAATAAFDASAATATGGLVAPVAGPPIDRRATVRYYRQMNPFAVFPVAVLFSARKLQAVADRDVAQVEGKQVVRVTQADPIVEIVPHFPGSLVAPERIRLDVRSEITRAVFAVTPLAEGRFDTARVDVYHQGRLVEEIPTPTRVVKQTATKIAVAAGFVAPFLSTTLELLAVDSSDQRTFLVRGLGWLLDQFGGWTGLGLTAGAAAFLASVVLYVRRRPREADPVTGTMEVDQWIAKEKNAG